MLRTKIVVFFLIAFTTSVQAFSQFLQISSKSSSFGLRARSSVPRQPRSLVKCQQSGGDELMREFEEERKKREEIDSIYFQAAEDLKSLSKIEIDALNQQAEETLKQREEEWNAMGAKAREQLTSKVDSLAEQFLKSTGRYEELEEEEDAAGGDPLSPPSVVALVAEPGPLRDELAKRLAAKGLTICSCERLLETVGMRLEEAEAVVLCGEGDAALDRGAVERLLARPKKLRRVLLVSSVGTKRADKFPFSMQNAFTGILDKKRDLELGLVERSRAAGFSYTIVRVGKTGKPDAAAAALELMPGDGFQEGTAADVGAEAAVQALLFQPLALNKSLSVVSRRGPAPTQDKWDDEFLKLDGPELWRLSLGPVGARACRGWLQESWAPRWIKKGSGLTTPVSLANIPQGVQLAFQPPRSDFVSFKEERERERARERGDDPPAGSGSAALGSARQLEGGIKVVVEEKPEPRVRAMRCCMGDETVVKETSERLILESLIKDLQAWTSDSRNHA